MSIVRTPRPESGWYALDKKISEDARLSWAARGLLVFLLGKPDNWRVSVEHLRKQTEAARIRTGRDGVYALLAELQGAGYIAHHQARHDDGTLGPVEYQVSEAPAPLPAQPDTVAPLPAQPYPAQPTLTKTETTARTEEQQAPRKRAAAAAIALPEWVPVDLWGAWLEVRRKNRAADTAKALELSLADLEGFRAQGEDPAEVLKQSIKRGWTGLFTTRNRGSQNAATFTTERRESHAQRIERVNREHDRRGH